MLRWGKEGLRSRRWKAEMGIPPMEQETNLPPAVPAREDALSLGCAWREQPPTTAEPEQLVGDGEEGGGIPWAAGPLAAWLMTQGRPSRLGCAVL